MCETETHRAKDIIKFYNRNIYTPINDEFRGFNYAFLSMEIAEHFNWEKSQFCHLIPTKPFTIVVDIVKRWSDEESEEYENNIEYWTEEDIEEVRRREEKEEKRNKQINTDKTFKSDECVICLTDPPNVLFCNCGHLCLCEECDEKHSVSVINSSCIFCDDVVTCTCPVCKTENTIKRTV